MLSSSLARGPRSSDLCSSTGSLGASVVSLGMATVWPTSRGVRFNQGSGPSVSTLMLMTRRKKAAQARRERSARRPLLLCILPSLSHLSPLLNVWPMSRLSGIWLHRRQSKNSFWLAWGGWQPPRAAGIQLETNQVPSSGQAGPSPGLHHLGGPLASPHDGWLRRAEVWPGGGRLC